MEQGPLTVKQAAEYLQVNTEQIRRYISKGLLKAYKLGNGKNERSTGPWRIWKADLIDFINRSGNVKES